MPQSDFWPFTRTKAVDDVDFSGEPSLLQKQLGDVEGELRELELELAAVKKIRLNRNESKGFGTDYEEHLLKEITTENFDVNKGDKYNKYTEVTKLREELIRAKNVADEEKSQRQKYEGKLKDLEDKLNNICCKKVEIRKQESRTTSNEEVVSLRNQIKILQEELEEMRLTVSEKTEQSQEYRVKYLQAQQQVEELKRQLDLIEFDNKQVTDQIQIEIQKMKMQFQEKLQELAPLPDLLKGSQIQLQEAKQLQKLAEDSSHQLSNELHRVKEKLVIAVNSLNQEKNEKCKIAEINKDLKATIEEKQREIMELNKCIDDHKCRVLRLEEKLIQEESRYQEKAAEYSQLVKDLDESRLENNRSLGRAKERSESMRRYLQTQISELERQLIQSRAQGRACQKERDEIRQRMQIQISNLQENFEMVEIRLRTLQNQVASLKSSYTVILADEENTELNKIATT